MFENSKPSNQHFVSYIPVQGKQGNPGLPYFVDSTISTPQASSNLNSIYPVGDDYPIGTHILAINEGDGVLYFRTGESNWSKLALTAI